MSSPQSHSMITLRQCFLGAVIEETPVDQHLNNQDVGSIQMLVLHKHWYYTDVGIKQTFVL